LEHPMGCWSREERERALRLMGISLSETLPDDPRFRPLWVNALAATDEVTAKELDWLFHTDTSHLEGEARLAEARKPLADEPTAKCNLLAIIRREQEALRALRAETWETVDRPALEAACARAQTFDPSGEATLASRYERSNASELARCLNLLGRLKREARRDGDAAPMTSPWLGVEPTTRSSAGEASEASGAPNEL